MYKKILSFTLLLLPFFPSYGETKEDTANESSEYINFSPNQKKELEYLLFIEDVLKAELNIPRHETNNSNKKEERREYFIKTHNKLTLNYESLTELYCMPYLYSRLEYFGSPTNKKCLSYLSELEKRFPESPIIPCVKEGINSPLCKEKYDNHYYDIYELDELTNDDVNLQNKLKFEKSQSEIDNLYNKVEDRIEKFKNQFKGKSDQKKKIEEKRAIDKDLATLINKSCQLSFYRLVHEEPQDLNKLTDVYRQKQVKSELHNMFKELKSQQKAVTPSPSPTPTYNKAYKEFNPFERKRPKQKKEKVKKDDTFHYLPTWRIRLISEECNEALQLSKKYNSKFPYATCVYYDKYSPQCIESWIKYKAILDKEKNKLNLKDLKSGHGFSTF